MGIRKSRDKSVVLRCNFFSIILILFFMPYAADAAITLYDNGPLINSSGTGAGGADESLVINPLASIGFNHSLSGGYRLADDFTVVDSRGWTIETITFYAYQTGSTTTSTIYHVNLRIWDGPPGNPASNVVWGDTTANILSSSVFSNIYRVLTSGDTQRPIMANTVTANVTLPAGTYWLDWQTGGTLVSGPWVPPITITGQQTTGNAMQYTVAWGSVVDSGPDPDAPQGLPFIISGTVNTTLTVDRSGSGDVTVNTGSLSWIGDTGTATYTTGTPVDLIASPLACSSFTWGGACAGNANPCSVTMDGDKNVTVSFKVNKMVRNLTSLVEADLIQTAIASASGGETIAARAFDSGEDVVLETGSIILAGGYDCDFSDHIGGAMTTINSLTVNEGEITLEYFTIN